MYAPRGFALLGQITERGTAMAPVLLAAHENAHVRGVYVNESERVQDIVATLPRFLDKVYNADRLHSALRYLNPAVFERRLAQP